MIWFDAFNPVTFSNVTNSFNIESVCFTRSRTLVSTDRSYRIFGLELVWITLQVQNCCYWPAVRRAGNVNSLPCVGDVWQPLALPFTLSTGTNRRHLKIMS